MPRGLGQFICKRFCMYNPNGPSQGSYMVQTGQPTAPPVPASCEAGDVALPAETHAAEGEAVDLSSAADTLAPEGQAGAALGLAADAESNAQDKSGPLAEDAPGAAATPELECRAAPRHRVSAGARRKRGTGIVKLAGPTKKEERVSRNKAEILAIMAMDCDNKKSAKLHKNTPGCSRCIRKFTRLCSDVYLDEPSEDITNCEVCLSLWKKAASLRADPSAVKRDLEILQSHMKKEPEKKELQQAASVSSTLQAASSGQDAPAPAAPSTQDQTLSTATDNDQEAKQEVVDVPPPPDPLMKAVTQAKASRVRQPARTPGQWCNDFPEHRMRLCTPAEAKQHPDVDHFGKFHWGCN